MGGHFQVEIGMLGTELREGFVGHRTHGEDCGQVGLINQEPHTSEYKHIRNIGPAVSP